MLPMDVFSGPWHIQVFHLPPPIRQIPLVRGAALIVWCARENSKARACPGEQEEGITPRHTTATPRRQSPGGRFAASSSVSGSMIAGSYRRQAFDPGGAGGRERGESRGPPGSWRRTTNRLRTDGSGDKFEDAGGEGVICWLHLPLHQHGGSDVPPLAFILPPGAFSPAFEAHLTRKFHNSDMY